MANHGTKNDSYARMLIEEYRSMSHDVHVVALTNVDKDWGSDVEVRVGAPTSDPWSLPFGHKRLFAERIDDYDLFVYTEDDTLLTEAHIESFLGATEVLPEHLIAGFVREEKAEDGRSFISTAHWAFRWDPRSIWSHGGAHFAHYTNDHAAVFVLTRAQLRRAIDSGGFLVDPYQSRYDLLVTAATDPYTQCGMKKVIGISNFDEFVLPHLPSAYIDKIGVSRGEFELQLGALVEIAEEERTAEVLLDTESRVDRCAWSKSFYEHEDKRVLEVLGAAPHSRVLSVGCGWGATEAAIAKLGHEVVGVALDAVIASCAEGRGVEVVAGSVDQVRESLRGREFDVVLFDNVLHLSEDPVGLLKAFVDPLRGPTRILVRTPNFGYLKTRVRRLRRVEGYRALGDYEGAGLHPTDLRMVKGWLRSCGADYMTVHVAPQPRFSSVAPWLPAMVARALSESMLVVAERPVS